MNFSEPLPGLFHLKPEPNYDDRGWFARVYSHAFARKLGLCTDFVEWSQSYSEKAYTLRGLHWQNPPEIKLIQCVRGSIFDVAVDLRRNSPNYGRHYAAILSAKTCESIYVPHGFAHAFQTLEDETAVLYHISEAYVPEGARGVRWNDPALAIPWPNMRPSRMSERDKTLPLLSQVLVE